MEGDAFLGGRYRAKKQTASEVDLATVVAIQKIEYDYKKAVHDQNLRAAERAHDFAHEYGRKMAEEAGRNATEAIKVALAINGGAAIAMMAFLGAFAKERGFISKILGHALWALGCFGVGVVFAAVTAALAYFSNAYFGEAFRAQTFKHDHPYVTENDESKRYWKRARMYSQTGICCAVLALILFVAGLILAGFGLAKLI